MPRVVKDHGGMTSDEWCSPPEVISPIPIVWGHRALFDPCSNRRSIVGAEVELLTGGLTRSWQNFSWVNWPYSQNDAWSAKALYEMRVGNVSEMIVLCMMAASTLWWQRMMLKPKRNPRVIATKRLKFIGPHGEKIDSSRFEPALIYYGSKHARFDRAYKHVAMWSTWGR